MNMDLRLRIYSLCDLVVSKYRHKDIENILLKDYDMNWITHFYSLSRSIISNLLKGFGILACLGCNTNFMLCKKTKEICPKVHFI